MKSKPIRLIEEAQAEHERHYDALFDHSVGNAERYRSEILKGFLAIAARPKGYGYVPGHSFRSYGPTRKEKYRIAYVETLT
jgi:plasmid stabilization system protein ParE